MERYRRRHKRTMTDRAGATRGVEWLWDLRSCNGQGTVEYALVVFAFLAVVAGAAALVRLFDGDAVGAHGLASASHGLLTPVGGVGDVLLY